MTTANQPDNTLKNIYLAVTVLIAIEALALIGCTLWLLVEIILGQSRSIEAAGMLVALVAVAAIWVGLIALRIREGVRWARSSAVFWQTCQLAIAWGSFTGSNANAAIGIALIVPSVLVLALLFSKPVIKAAETQV